MNRLTPNDNEKGGSGGEDTGAAQVAKKFVRSFSIGNFIVHKTTHFVNNDIHDQRLTTLALEEAGEYRPGPRFGDADHKPKGGGR